MGRDRKRKFPRSHTSAMKLNDGLEAELEKKKGGTTQRVMSSKNGSPFVPAQ